jgi:hypothetical protein
LFCYLDDSISWVWMNSVSFGIVTFHCCYAILFLRMPFILRAI